MLQHVGIYTLGFRVWGLGMWGGGGGGVQGLGCQAHFASRKLSRSVQGLKELACRAFQNEGLVGAALFPWTTETMGRSVTQAEAKPPNRL